MVTQQLSVCSSIKPTNGAANPNCGESPSTSECRDREITIGTTAEDEETTVNPPVSVIEEARQRKNISGNTGGPHSFANR